MFKKSDKMKYLKFLFVIVLLANAFLLYKYSSAKQTNERLLFDQKNREMLSNVYRGKLNDSWSFESDVTGAVLRSKLNLPKDGNLLVFRNSELNCRVCIDACRYFCRIVHMFFHIDARPCVSTVNCSV